MAQQQITILAKFGEAYTQKAPYQVLNFDWPQQLISMLSVYPDVERMPFTLVKCVSTLIKNTGSLKYCIELGIY